MTYLFLWLICSICSFYLLKNYVESNLRSLPSPPENIAQAMRNAAKRDDLINGMEGCPDNIAIALFWTISLVICLVVWPLVLTSLVWWKIDKQDFSDFRGV